MHDEFACIHIPKSMCENCCLLIISDLVWCWKLHGYPWWRNKIRCCSIRQGTNINLSCEAIVRNLEWHTIPTFQYCCLTFHVDKIVATNQKNWTILYCFYVFEFQIPVYQRGGYIVPRKERIRRSSSLTRNDPFTLIVCLDKQVKYSFSTWCSVVCALDWHCVRSDL